MDKTLTVAITLMAAGLTYAGAVQSYEDIAIIWTAATWFGGFFSALLALHMMKGE
jgi:hypothetical protein